LACDEEVIDIHPAPIGSEDAHSMDITPGIKNALGRRWSEGRESDACSPERDGARRENGIKSARIVETGA
jgi:hypothetical protein